MRTGTVKFFNHKNKFGFVIDDETKKEYYVHIKDVVGEVDQNDRVSFELQDAPKGPQCAQVKKIE
jgi:CspA family cold shock protein